VSSIPAVLAALTTLGVATLLNSQVINGPRATVTTTDDRLLIVGEEVTSGQRDLDSMAIGTTSEQYTVSLAVSADVPGTDQTAADALELAVFAAMELAIREYPGGPNLGLGAQGVLSVLPTGAFELKRIASADGRHAAVKWSVAVYAQNT
jgi:hypothetical protein